MKKYFKGLSILLFVTVFFQSLCFSGVSIMAAGESITILYKCSSTGDSSVQLSGSIQVINNSTSATIDLANIKLRYWYTRDGNTSQSFVCDYAQIGSAKVSGTFNTMANPVSTADNYLEIGFGDTPGTLAPGASSGEIQFRIFDSTYESYTQTNDYSFNSSLNNYGENAKITAYYNDVLNYGSEPLISTPTKTATPTITASVTPAVNNLRVEKEISPSQLPHIHWKGFRLCKAIL